MPRSNLLRQRSFEQTDRRSQPGFPVWFPMADRAADESVEQAEIRPSRSLAGPHGDRIVLQRLSSAATTATLAVAGRPFPVASAVRRRSDGGRVLFGGGSHSGAVCGARPSHSPGVLPSFSTVCGSMALTSASATVLERRPDKTGSDPEICPGRMMSSRGRRVA